MELLVVLNLFITFFQTPTGDFLMSIVPIVIAIATPFIVQFATDLVIKYIPTIKAWGIVAIVVPVLAGLVTVIFNFITSAGPVWYLQLGFGLLAVFVNELYKAVKERGGNVGVGQQRKRDEGK